MKYLFVINEEKDEGHIYGNGSKDGEDLLPQRKGFEGFDNLLLDLSCGFDDLGLERL
jgi:hypothetical protein